MLHFYSEFESRCVKIVVDKVENKQKEASISPFKTFAGRRAASACTSRTSFGTT